MITVTVKTMDGAVTKALIELETTGNRLEYKVVDKESTGFFGIGTKPTITCAKRRESIEGKAMGFLSQIFRAMSIQVNIAAACNQEEQELSLDLEGEDMGILIGKRGQILDFLQYLMSLIVNKGTERYLKIKLNTENYRERRKGTLETLAKNIAYKVKRTKRPIFLEPTNPYERRIIRATFQNDKYVTTRNEGEEPFRRMMTILRKEAVSGGRKGRHDKSKGGRSERSDRSGGYRDNRHTNGNNASQIGSDAPAETATDEEE